jgi:hypothetical protein
VQGTCLVHLIDKRLGIISGEISDHIDLIRVRENRRNQGDALALNEGIVDQTFPRLAVAAQNKIVGLKSVS